MRNGIIRKGSILAALLLLAPAVSQAKTLEELLVEKGVITKGEAAGAVRSTSNGPAKVYYNEGTRLEFPDAGFTTRINTLLQTRYTFADKDEDAGRRNTSSFDVNTARVFIHGTALHQEFSYMLDADFVGTNNEHLYPKSVDQNESRRNPALKDAWIKWTPCEGVETQMGQFRTFVSRQFTNNMADWQRQFVDNSVVSDHFDLGRLQGAAQRFVSEDKMFEAGAGIWTGNSVGEGINSTGVDVRETGGAYVRINPTGQLDPNQEGDINNTEELATTLAASYHYSQGELNPEAPVARNQFDLHTVSAGGMLKSGGFSLDGEWFWNQYQLQHGDFDDIKHQGFYAQTGYFLEPQKWEVAARYGYLDCDGGRGTGVCVGNRYVNEVAGTINYYWWKHQMKAQLGYSFVNEDAVGGSEENDTKDINSNRWIFQLSSFF